VKSLALIALAALCGGCVTFRFERTLFGPGPKPAELEALRVGESGFEDALRALGAPLLVWELAEDGKALAWGWQRDVSRGVTLSVPLDHYGSVSASYDDQARRLHGVVLLFDAGGRLVDRREGFLGALREQLERKRPALIEDEPK